MVKKQMYYVKLTVEGTRKHHFLHCELDWEVVVI